MIQKLKLYNSKLIYNVYVIFLLRNLILFSSGYSGIYMRNLIIINFVICLILFLVIFFYSKKYNIYVLVLINFITVYGIKYSGFNDKNSIENMSIICIYIILTIFQIIFLVYDRYIRRKKYRKILLIICFIIFIKPFVEYYHHYYSRPKSIDYDTTTKNEENIKNEDDMLKAISKLPLVDIVYYEDEKNKKITIPQTELAEDGFFQQTDLKKEGEIMLLVSVKNYIDYETTDRLAKKIKRYIKLVGKDNKKVRLHLATLKSREFPIKIYEIQNNIIKEIYKLDNIRETEDVFELIALFPTIIIKGSND